MAFHQFELFFQCNVNCPFLCIPDLSKPPQIVFPPNTSHPPPVFLLPNLSCPPPNITPTLTLPDFSKPPPANTNLPSTPFLNYLPPTKPIICSSSEFNTFFKLKTQIVTIGSDISYLQKCKEQNVYPNFIDVSTKKKDWIGNKVIQAAKKHWLNLKLKSLYAKRNKLELQLYNLHLKLTKNLSSLEFALFNEKVCHMLEVIEHKNLNKLATQSKKLSKLAPKTSNSPAIAKFDIVHNLSKQQFTEKETNFLNMGLNFNLPISKTPLDSLIVDIESAIKFLPEEEKSFIRNACKFEIQHSKSVNHKVQENYSGVLKSLKAKDCYYIKSDKSNAVVIMDKTDYCSKVEEMLISGPYDLISKSPLDKFQRQLKATLQTCKTFVTKELKKVLIVPNPVLPKLYCLPKVHKPGVPMRPIVSGIDSPTYKLSKFLVKQFSQLQTQPKSFSVKNNLEFISKVKDIKLSPNDYLVSFDITAMFPSIPITETIEFLESLLTDNNFTPTEINELVVLTRLCMNQNSFQFNGRYYTQTFGTAMGNCLSPFMANLFMSYFETKLCESFPDFPKTFIRYVDDIFAIVSYTPEKLAEFVDLLNSQYPSIKFTTEIEVGSKLPFLDMLICRENGSLSFDIYRKPTNVNRFIDNSSFHPKQHKIAAFNSMIHRMLSFPLSKSNLTKETAHIKQVAEQNGFATTIIDNLIRKQKFKLSVEHSTTLPTQQKKTKWAKLLYFPPLSNNIAKIFAKHDIKMASYSNNRIKSLLPSTKDKTPTFEKSGIYKISCSECEDVYIGQTIRDIETRYKEHDYNYRYNKSDKSSVAKHRHDTGHKITSENLSLLHQTSNKRQIDALETLYIFKEKHPLMNADNGPLQYSSLIKLAK